MRLVPALLLLLLLPGLLVPAGIALRWCRCEHPMTGAASCCATKAAPMRSCCEKRSTRPTNVGDTAVVAAKEHGKCRCTWIKAPDDRPDPTPPPAADPVALPAPAIAAIGSPIVPTCTRCDLTVTVACRAPPDRARCLPLLL
ncbi:MAG: hypothetical protein JNK78_01545 [Planctomycetes bacterium]|nr:hypothetical protein [Planctomycetota bacterium]